MCGWGKEYKKSLKGAGPIIVIPAPWSRSCSMFKDAANEDHLRAHAHSKPSPDRTKWSHSQLTPQNAFREGGPKPIELQTFTPSLERDHFSSDRIRREARRAQKQRQKRIELGRREEMKFSHSIQFNAVPDWSSHYISYSNLKKLYGFQGILTGASVEGIHRCCQC